LPFLGRELDGVRQQVQQHLAQRAAVGAQARQGLAAGGSSPSRPPSRAAGSIVRSALFRHVDHVERLVARLEAPGLDLGHVEHLVDDLEQVAARTADVARIVAVAVPGLGRQQVRRR
jgi:hypothetical protein